MEVVPEDAYADWESVYRDNVERVYRLMYAKVGNRPDAEDLTAEVFLAALGPLRLTASGAEVRSYLYATARTVLASHWRRTLGHQVTVLSPDELPEGPPAGSGESGTIGGNAPVTISAVLARLPARYRRILQLRFLESHSVREAAAALQITVANAKVLQHRALRLAADMAAQSTQAGTPEREGPSDE